MTARDAAYAALVRIEQKGAFANLVLDATLRRAALEERDRRFATQLVYGTTRMRRACDFLVDRFLLREVDDDVRTLLRLGAYQLHYLSTPPHAAVDATVGLASRKTRGFVNAVLRKVAAADVVWPSEAVRLSYPDWLVERLVEDLGESDAFAALAHMNLEPTVHERDDGYIQDPASQWVCEVVDAQPHHLVLDSCAAPGGKATLLASNGARVIASDRRMSRARLVSQNADRTGATTVQTLVADGTALPLVAGSFDRVLVDAPCSGLGVLRRRADARWRIDDVAISRLSALQTRLLRSAADQVADGGLLVYSVCTMTRAETIDVAATLTSADFTPVDVVTADAPWRQLGQSGGMILPQDHDSDGMSIFAWRRDR